jgi:hypothetical protein
MSAGVEGAGVIATDAAISIVVGIVKISVFGIAGVITAQVIVFALLTGLVALPGAFLAKTFVERMPMHVHTAILDAVVLLGGIFLVWISVVGSALNRSAVAVRSTAEFMDQFRYALATGFLADL